MKIDSFIDRIQNLGINDFIGVPDSTLKPFCDYLYTNISSNYHHVTVNEGSAIALATGIYLGTQKISCVYMQNSGIDNALNPIPKEQHVLKCLIFLSVTSRLIYL